MPLHVIVESGECDYCHKEGEVMTYIDSDRERLSGCDRCLTASHFSFNRVIFILTMLVLAAAFACAVARLSGYIPLIKLELMLRSHLLH